MIIDIHVHYFPCKIFKAVWKFFEVSSKGLWPIPYKVCEQELIQSLQNKGVSRFAGLFYAHKKGLAAYLNDFMYQAAQAHPQIIPFGTVYAGDDNIKATSRQIFEQYYFYGVKMHPFVSLEQMDDPRFFPLFEIMEGLGKVFLVHGGSAPVFTDKKGPDRLRNLLKNFPRLKVIVAHFGAYEYDQFLDIARHNEHVYFDTAMIGIETHVFTSNFLNKEVYLEFQDRILFGSDYPNIPYPFEKQVEAIRSLDLPKEVEQKIFYQNAQQLLSIE